MGQDKAILPFDGKSLIDHALATMREVAEPVWIVGRRPDLAHYAPVIEDRHAICGVQGCGPVGGIEAALSASPSELNLFLPVDTPFLPARFLRWMLQRAVNSGAAATVPVVHGQPQPLIAVYSRRLLPALTRAIEAGRLKTIEAIIQASQQAGGADLFRMEVVSPLFLPHLVSTEPNANRTGQWFRNLNTPADLETEPLAASILTGIKFVSNLVTGDKTF